MTPYMPVHWTGATLAALTLLHALGSGSLIASPALSPSSLSAAPNAQTLYIGCATTPSVLFMETATGRITRSTVLPSPASGLALRGDGSMLYVTCPAPQSTVCEIDTSTGRVVRTMEVGHTASDPVLSPDERSLFVCARFDNRIDQIDLASGRVMRRLIAPREPVSAAVTPDGRHLLVANHLQAGRANADVVRATVTVLDLRTGGMVKELELPNGSTLLRDLRISPDGRHAVVVHQLARFHLPTTQIERGWINTSAMSLIDLQTLDLLTTVLLDNINAGAANPWAVAWDTDGSRIMTTHAGTHELSIIDFRRLLERIHLLGSGGLPDETLSASRTLADVPNDLAFLVGLRQRIQLTAADRGPRSLVVAGGRAWIGNFFSDTLSVIDLDDPDSPVRSIALGSCSEDPAERRGEAYFNDATLCFQGWQSCASCHSNDARVDGMNWDNLNDGIGNPKNSKSLLLAPDTPPMMWLGVRADSAAAVRAGIPHALFTVQPEEVATALDAYLRSLSPMPSPHLEQGHLSLAGERGRKLFFSETTRCANCHRGDLYTDQKQHRVGTIGRYDAPGDRFDTPSLVEIWRTAPFIHDGSALTVKEVLTSSNPDDLHGQTSHLTPQEIEDLATFLLSL